MIWLRRRKTRPLEPKKKINPRLLELQVAKDILAEIFHARPEDIEDMIQNRLEERSWPVEQMPAPDGLWPAAFCLGE